MHALVISVLVKSAKTPNLTIPKKRESQVIKSFLYVKPVPLKVEKLQLKQELKQPKEKVTKETTTEVPQIKEQVQKDIKKIDSAIQEKQKLEPNRDKVVATSQSVKKEEKIQKKKVTSSMSLSKLKDKINQQIINQQILNNPRPYTGSIMDGTPVSVPHSTVENKEMKAISSTATQVGNGFSITKGDNGTCTLTEDLSVIGLQGKTKSTFDCGQSKDEKSFKDHMKKVLKKLGK